jgi:hypothetical protein
VIHEPIRPDEPLEIVFSFALPYDRALDFDQAIDIPVDAVILLTENDAPEIEGEGLQDLGARDMGGLVLRNYAMQAISAGDMLSLRLRGGHPLSQSNLSSSNLSIGLAVFSVVILGAGLALWIWQRRAGDHDDTTPGRERPTRGSDELLKAIAALDDAYEAGELDQIDYEQQRAALKAQILEQMSGDD